MTVAEFIYTVLLRPRPLRSLANATLRRLLPATRTLRGAVVHLNPDDPVISGALTLGVYERDEIDFFCRHLEAGMTFVDVGANVGLYSALAARRLGPRGRLLSIEPDPDSLHWLHRTLAANDGAEAPGTSLFEGAVADAPGRLTLYRNLDNRGDNRIYEDPMCDAPVTVVASTLDALADAHGLDAVDFLKIDVQGAEPKVLAGGRALLARSADCILMSEFWPEGMRACGGDAGAYLADLEALGFRLFEPHGRELRPIGDHAALIERCQGRAYANLVGLKGRFSDPAGNPSVRS
ncbi:MAG TPA: FkbM family methyltransferase [Pseudomonadales bacterium]|nr:FkbM family methyltransferase [Pseudomonadales bacterium]